MPYPLHILPGMKRTITNGAYSVLLAAFLGVVAGCAGKPAGFTLALSHINDTHGHLAPASVELRVDNETVRAEAGGFARVAAVLERQRRNDPETLFLHAGDVFTGTLYFKRFAGRADCTLLNAMGLDAMAVGNHELDRGPVALADFAALADFPLLSANLDASQVPLLQRYIKPYVIKKVHGRDVGIIGLTTPEALHLSRPGAEITFLDPAAAARRAVDELTGRGVRIIVILSHLGYRRDLQLAPLLPGVDIIVGGHSHTLLGDFAALERHSAGPYPAVCTNADNATALVVQAWEWAKIVGHLTVSFDADGNITAWQGSPVLPLASSFTRDGEPLPEQERHSLLAQLDRNPDMPVTDEDERVSRLLEPYARVVEPLYRHVVTRAPADIAHVRMPGGRYPAGSMLAPLVAHAMLWKLRSEGLEVDAALTNAGAVRDTIFAGQVTAGRIEEVLPFGDTLVVCRLQGSEIRRALAAGVDRAVEGETGSFPYVAGLRYTVDFSRPRGGRVTAIDMRESGGVWQALDGKKWYRLVTNNYLAAGRGGYDFFAALGDRARDTGFGDAESFMEFAERRPQLTRLPDTLIKVVREK